MLLTRVHVSFPCLLAVIAVSLATIYNSGSVFLTTNSSLGFYLIVIAIICLSVYRFRMFSYTRLDLLTKSYSILVIASFASAVANLRFLGGNLRFLSIITLSYLVVRTIKFRLFLKAYSLIMLIITLISLVFWVLINSFGINMGLPIIENINGVKYYNAFVFVTNTYSTIRNMAVFWEPGIFASFLTIGMLLETFFGKPKPSAVLLIVFAIGILSTISTAGYFLLLFVLVSFIFRSAKTARSFIIGVFLMVILLLLFINIRTVLEILYKFSPTIISKLIQGTDNASVFHRLESPIANLEIYTRNPLFGASIGNVDFQYSGITSITQSSTSTYYLATFGILGFAPTYFLMICVFGHRRINLLSRIIILLILLIIINKEPHFYFPATYMISFYLLKLVDENMRNSV